MDEYDVTNSSPEPKKSYTYTIDVLAENGYSFSDLIDVEVYGATSVSIKSKSSSKVTVKVKTYPYHVLAEPSNIRIDEAGKKADWDIVSFAKNYSVMISYTNKNGEERETKKTVTKNTIDLDGYMGKYENVDVAVRAMKGTTDADKFISNSDYVNSDGSVNEDNSTEAYEFNIPTAKSDGTTANSTNGGSSYGNTANTNGPGSMNGSDMNSGWIKNGDNWSYIHNGSKVNGWLGLHAEEWYLFDSNGIMLSGWQFVNGSWYLLNLSHDGTFGKMLAGWQTVNGKQYYLNPLHDGTYGAMYVNRTTSDGHIIGADGALIQ